MQKTSATYIDVVIDRGIEEGRENGSRGFFPRSQFEERIRGYKRMHTKSDPDLCRQQLIQQRQFLGFGGDVAIQLGGEQFF